MKVNQIHLHQNCGNNMSNFKRAAISHKVKVAKTIYN